MRRVWRVFGCRAGNVEPLIRREDSRSTVGPAVQPTRRGVQCGTLATIITTLENTIFRTGEVFDLMLRFFQHLRDASRKLGEGKARPDFA